MTCFSWRWVVFAVVFVSLSVTPVMAKSKVSTKGVNSSGAGAKSLSCKNLKTSNKKTSNKKTVVAKKKVRGGKDRIVVGQRGVSAKKTKFVFSAPVKGGVGIKKASAFALDSDTPVDLRGRLTCRSAFIMDARTGKVLYDRHADDPGQPASTIKVLTGLIAMESLNGNELVPASSYAANMPASKINIKKGAYYQASDLINAVLLASANDASVALAEKLAGSEQAFARLMTKKAEALGAQNTICKSANGLTRPGQQTTARDLALVFNRAMKNPEFAERMLASQARTSDGRVLRSHNKALWTVDGAVGGKTGFTNAAGKTYVGKFRRGGQEIVVSLLGSNSMWSDVSALVEYGFARQDLTLGQINDQHAISIEGQKNKT